MMADARTQFVNYYEVLKISPKDPNLRKILIDKQAAILAGSDENKQEQLQMVLTLLDPQVGAEYKRQLNDHLQSQTFRKEQREVEEYKRNLFDKFLSNNKELMKWFIDFVNSPDSAGQILPHEHATIAKDPLRYHFDKSFEQEESVALSKKIAGLLVADTVVLDNFFSRIDPHFPVDRLEYIWNALNVFFAETDEFQTIIARLRQYIFAQDITTLVNPSPESFQLIHEIFATSPALEQKQAFDAIINAEGFLYSVKRHFNASIRPRLIHETSHEHRQKTYGVSGRGNDFVYHTKSVTQDPYVPTLKECFQYLPDKGDAIGMLVINNPEELTKFGTDENFWKNFSDEIQARMAAAVKVESDNALILSNIKIKEYFEEIQKILSAYLIGKIKEQAALQVDEGALSKARVTLFAKEDNRGLQRVKILLSLFNDAANDPMRQLILTLAVLANKDSKKLRNDMAAKIKNEDVIDLLSKRLILLHGEKATLAFSELKAKILDPLNGKTNHPAASNITNILEAFQPEIAKIKELEVTGVLQKFAEYKV
jgi:hypothetical protein